MSSAPAAPTTGHADPRVPARERCVVRYLIDRWAAERGDQPYVIFDGGRHWTYRELREQVIAIAVGLQRAGREAGRARAVLAAEHARDAAHVLRAQLPRRGVRPDQHGLSRRRARARHREFGRAGSRSCTATSCRGSRKCKLARLERLVVTGADEVPPRAAAGRAFLDAAGQRGRPAAARAPDRAVGHAVDHLHVRHDGPVEGRAVVLPAHVHEPGSGGLALHRRQRPLPRQHADVPHRRHGAQLRDARARRLDRAARALLDGHVLAARARDARRPRCSCSA